jgi:serine/threonine protein kinase
MIPAPTTADRTPREILEEGLGRWLSRPVRIDTLEGAPLEAWSTYPIDRLQVTLPSGEQLPVIFKRLRVGAGLKGNRREVLIYRRLLAGRRFGAPTLYASVYDEVQERYWLFLEDVGEDSLKRGDREDWMAAVRLLAQMHGTYWGREDELRALGCLGDHGPDYYQEVVHTVGWYLGLARNREGLARLNALMPRYPELAAYLVRQPRTFIHGDIFPDNLLLQPNSFIRLIDWESASVGLGAWDLARLLDGWEKEHPAFVAVYLEALEKETGLSADRREFDRTFSYCQILNSLWHLAWDVEKCKDGEFVDEALTDIERLWKRLDQGGKNG